jgi:hypothetical protein
MRTVSGAARIFTRCNNKKIRITKNNASTMNNNSGSSSSSATTAAGVGGRTSTSSAQQPSFRFKSTSSSSTPSASSTNNSTRYCRPIGCHVSSYLGNNTTTSLLSLMEPSKVTLDECEFDEDDIDGT